MSKWWRLQLSVASANKFPETNTERVQRQSKKKWKEKRERRRTRLAAAHSAYIFEIFDCSTCLCKRAHFLLNLESPSLNSIKTSTPHQITPSFYVSAISHRIDFGRLQPRLYKPRIRGRGTLTPPPLCQQHQHRRNPRWSASDLDMRILKARSALLSDFEVLKVLKEMEVEQKDRVKTTSHISEIADQSDAQGAKAALPKGDEDDVWLSKVPENLRTIQYEVSHRLKGISESVKLL